MVQGRGRLRAAAVIALLAAPALGACDRSSTAPDTPPSTSGPSPSTVPSASPSATAGPVAPEAPEPPKARRGPVGQKAFAEFVMDAWSWSLRSNDAGPLLDVSPSRRQPCQGCRALERELEGRADEGWYVDFPGLTVERTRLRRDGTDVIATSRVDIPESDSYQDDGSYRSTSPAHNGATFTVTMRHVKGSYRLVSFAVG